MNKTKFLLALAAPALMLTTACSSDDIEQLPNDGTVTFKVSIPENMTTRTFNNGETASNIGVAVYDTAEGSNGQLLMANFGTGAKNGDMISVTRSTENPLEFNVTIQLVKGKNYNFAFWAYATGAPYTYDCTSQEITVSYDGATTNDEARDAFYAYKNFPADGQAHEVTLYRPFAQINIGTNDIETADKAGLTVSQAGVSFSNLSTTFNLATGKASGSAENATFAVADLPTDETFPVPNYEYLTMAYVLVGDADSGKSVINNVGLNINSQTGFATYPNVPAQQNYRTNIYGSLLTNPEVFTVVIEPNFNKPANDIPTESWASTTETVPEVQNNTMSISTPGQLAAFAREINENGKTFPGVTVKLTGDIDLGGRLWEPIVNKRGAQFGGTFDGGGYTIKNMVVRNNSQSGFFGSAWGMLQNVNFDNALVQSNHYGGVLMGYATDHCVKGIKNIKVTNSTVILAPEFVQSTNKFNNGDKAGGIVGYIDAQSSGFVFDNCSVENVTIHGFRDCGLIAGYANTKLTNCTATKGTVIYDGSTVNNNYGDPGDTKNFFTNYSLLNGRKGGSTSLQGCSYTNCTLKYQNWENIGNQAFSYDAQTALVLDKVSANSFNLKIPANGNVTVSDCTFTAMAENPGGTFRFGIFVDTTADGYNLTVNNCDFKSSWSHAIYFQNKVDINPGTIRIANCRFTDWSKKEALDGKPGGYGSCVKVYGSTIAGDGPLSNFASLTPRGQAFVTSFFNSGNTWTMPAGYEADPTDYTVLQLAAKDETFICFTEMPK